MGKTKQMPQSEKIRFRGAEFRHIDMRVIDGNAFVRAHVRADITPELAEYFRWEIYRSGHLISGLEGTTKLAGELQLEEATFQPNGANVTGLECVVATAEAFQLSRKQADTGGIETSLMFVLRSSAWRLVTEFFGMMGSVDGMLVLTTVPQQQELDADEQQMKLGEDRSEGEAANTETEAEESGSRESRVVNGGRNLVSHRQAKLRRTRQPDDSAADDADDVQPMESILAGGLTQ